jgi:hypothetical protein
MGEALKDAHRKPRPAPDDKVTMEMAVLVEAPKVQPVPPPNPPLWVPWSLHH